MHPCVGAIPMEGQTPFAEDMPTGSSSLESIPGAAIVETMMEVSQKSKAKTTMRVCVY